MVRKVFWWALLLGNLGFIVAEWYLHSGSLLGLNWGIAWGRLTGLLAVFFILLQFVMIGRIPWLEKAWSFDRLSYWHHWVGFLSLITMLLHPLFLTIGYAMGNGVWKQFLSFLFEWDELLPAAGSILLFIGIVVTSIIITKWRMKYEWWYLVHLSTYVAVLWAFEHQLESGGDFVGNVPFVMYWWLLYIVALGAFALFRFGTLIWNFGKHQFRVEKIVPETHDAWSMYITGRNLASFAFKPGQFAMFRFLDARGWYQSHPFSISSMPGMNSLRITFKGLGDYSKIMKDIAPGTKVIVDGPHGKFIPDRSTRQKVAFIAGGVGITPVRSVLEALQAQGKDCVLVYGMRTQRDCIFDTEFKALQRDADKRIYICSETAPDGEVVGRIDQERIARCIPDIQERDVYFCGPAPMMASVMKALKALHVPKSQWIYEKFSLGGK